MMKLSVEDMIPKKSSFKLAALPGHDFEMRALNADDKMWIISNFGSEMEINQAFDKNDWVKLCRIVYRLLEDKSALPAKEVEEYDDDGTKVTVVLTGPKQLQRMIVGPKEQSAVLKALLETVGMSKKILEALLAEHEEQKKKDPVGVKTTPAPVGGKSSISSRPSTAGRSKKSASTASSKSSTR